VVGIAGEEVADVSTEPSVSPEASGNGQPRVEALKLEYEYVRDENIRLREGRASLTRQLGPLPISAAIVAGLVTGFTGTVNRNAYLWSALILFGALVVISSLYSVMYPYRVLRQEKEAAFPRSTQSAARWYENAIALEKAIYGDPTAGRGLRARLPTSKVKGLQDGYDRERSGLFIVQLLFALVIILLIISQVIGVSEGGTGTKIRALSSAATSA
jgi:hypothetical protein